MKTNKVKRTKGKVLATGYKIFTNNWGSKNSNYIYGTEKDIVGSVHKVDGDIKECQWGLHFSKNPLDCLKYYEIVQWNKFAKVEAYDKIIDKGDKIVSQMIKIVETYTFDEFVEKIKEFAEDSSNRGVNYAWGVNNASGVNNAWGVNDASGVNNAWGVSNCEGISRCIMCYDYTGKLAIFNKKVSEDRFVKIINEIKNYDWYPIFNNSFDLKSDKEWEETNIPAITSMSVKDAWNKMPKELEDYIKSLKEYDEKIFNKITGRK